MSRKADPILNLPERVIKEKCHVNTFDYTKGPECYGNTCPGAKPDRRFKTTNMMGVLKKRQGRSKFLPSRYNGQVPVKRRQINAFDDKCRVARNTPFGTINYRDFGKVSFKTSLKVLYRPSNMEDIGTYVSDNSAIAADGSYIPDGSFTSDGSDISDGSCAGKCFSKAGCTAWWRTVEPESCELVIGPTEYLPTKPLRPHWTSDGKVVESGRIDDLCPTATIKNEFNSKIVSHTVAFAGRDPKELLEEIFFSRKETTPQQFAANFTQESNGFNIHGINGWTFKTISQNPPITASQYFSLTIEHWWTRGYDDFTNVSRPQTIGFIVRFFVQTHVRIGQTFPNDRKRRADEEENPEAMMPRTEDILAQINAINQEAFDNIEQIQFPDDVEVIAKGPIETVQLVQKTAGGSIAADCLSGSCQCSKGFIDNGNGCIEMTPKQAATTQAPTTQAPTTPTQSRDWIPSLVDKIQEIFEADRPGKARPHLLKKWEKLRDKFNGRYKSMANNGCEFPDIYDDDSMRTVLDFDSIDACRVSGRIPAIFFRPYYMVPIFKMISGHQSN